jgi:cellulose synthase/poly-beta-1,6-N-acetylglucosamine synthase-like glycosyltransferase
MVTILLGLYFVLLIGVAVYGFNALVLSGLFIKHRKYFARAPKPEIWPHVTVQLPIYNEKYVIERLIEAVVGLDYPPDKLSIQILDDSTDETVALARVCVARYQLQGVNIAHVRRPNRTGFKAGALAYGLQSAPGEFIAIFDADFVPPSDFLRKTVPHFADVKTGAVQVRWGHLNAEYDALTRAQALALDGHFVVEQSARSRAGLLFNFNGSGGIWRRDCILEAGGWQADTLAEDLDLSYRAQLAGWKLAYLQDVVAPAEVPPMLTAFKRQQFRWAKGSIQCLRKMAGPLLRVPLSPWQKLQAFLHLSAYLVHPLLLGLILIGLPVILLRDPGSFPLSALGLAGFAPPILFAISQIVIYPDWKRRFMFFPFLVFLGGGITLNNTRATLEAVFGRNSTLFLRTPKFRTERREGGDLKWAGDYRLPVDWTTWGEIGLCIYCLIEAWVAFKHAPGLVPFLLVYALGYAYTAGLGLKQSWRGMSIAGQAHGSKVTQG